MTPPPGAEAAIDKAALEYLAAVQQALGTTDNGQGERAHGRGARALPGYKGLRVGFVERFTILHRIEGVMTGRD